MVETCLPGDDLDVQNPYSSPLGIGSNSMSSLSMGSLHSPTDKDSVDLDGNRGCGNGARMRHGSASHVAGKCRVAGGSFKRKGSKKKSPDSFE